MIGRRSVQVRGECRIRNSDAEIVRIGGSFRLRFDIMWEGKGRCTERTAN